MNKYFIPEVKTVNNIQIPSTPFKGIGNKTIFLGDIITVNLPEGNTESYLIEMIDGQYVCTDSQIDNETPLWILDSDSITVLGSSEEDISLLDLLKVI